MEIVNQLLSFTDNDTIRAAIVLAIVIVAIIFLAYLMKRISYRGAGNKRGRVARLSIVEAIAVDQRRRLVLIRRDNTEHLVMIGGSSDTVIEQGIQRIARAAGAQRQAAERADQRTVTRRRPGEEPKPGERGPAVARPAAGMPQPGPAPATGTPRPAPAPAQPVPAKPAPIPAPSRSTAQSTPVSSAIPPKPAIQNIPVEPVASPPVTPPTVAVKRPMTEAGAPSPVPTSPAPASPAPAPMSSAPSAKVEPVVPPPLPQVANPVPQTTAAGQDTGGPQTISTGLSGNEELPAKEQQLAEMERQLENALRGSVSEVTPGGAAPSTPSMSPDASNPESRSTGASAENERTSGTGSESNADGEKPAVEDSTKIAGS